MNKEQIDLVGRLDKAAKQLKTLLQSMRDFLGDQGRGKVLFSGGDLRLEIEGLRIHWIEEKGCFLVHFEHHKLRSAYPCLGEFREPLPILSILEGLTEYPRTPDTLYQFEDAITTAEIKKQIEDIGVVFDHGFAFEE